MTNYYVSTAGDDTAPGTKQRPLGSFEPLSSPDSPLEPGDTVYVRGGTIRSRGVVLRDVRGRPGAPISIVADGDAIPVVDCTAGDAAGFELDRCVGVTIRGLVISGAARDGIRVVGSETSDITIAGVDVRNYARSGEGNGIRITGGSNLSVRGCYLREGNQSAGAQGRGITIGKRAGLCRVLDSEFYRNPGGGATATNVGDPDRVVFRRCIAHRNGFDAWGRRMGGTPGFQIDGVGVLDRCVAYNNGGPGFEATGRGTTTSIVHATAWANAGVGYRIAGANLANCLAAANRDGAIERPGGRVERVDGWIKSGGGHSERGLFAADTSEFRTTDDTVPAFLQPREDATVVDSGIDLGRLCTGKAPDVGARSAATAAAPRESDARKNASLADHSEVLRDWRLQDWRHSTNGTQVALDGVHYS
jgi:hypothetical protein